MHKGAGCVVFLLFVCFFFEKYGGFGGPGVGFVTEIKHEVPVWKNKLCAVVFGPRQLMQAEVDVASHAVVFRHLL